MVSTTTRTRSGSIAEFLDRDLSGDGVDALAHLRPAVADFDRSVRIEADRRTTHLVGAVAEARVLEPEPHADRVSGGCGRVPCRLHRVEAGAGAEGAVVHDLARAPHGTPGSTTLRLRISQPEMPTMAARRSIIPSMAN